VNEKIQNIQYYATMLLKSVLAATALVGAVFAAPAAEKKANKLKWFGIRREELHRCLRQRIHLV
jgi:hypothetical protein